MAMTWVECSNCSGSGKDVFHADSLPHDCGACEGTGRTEMTTREILLAIAEHASQIERLHWGLRRVEDMM